MRRFGVLSYLLFLWLFAAVGSLSAAGVGTIPVDTFRVCVGETVYDTVKFPINNPATASLEIFDGFGSVNSIVLGDTLIGYYSRYTETDNFSLVQYLLIDGVDSTYLTYRYDIYVDEAPIIIDQYHSIYNCAGAENRFIKVYARDPESIPLVLEMLSGPGQIDSATGYITYLPDTAGVYSWQISASDACSSDTAFVYDTVSFNTLPKLPVNDTTIYVSDTGNVCFDMYVFDAEGDSVIWVLNGGSADFTQIDDSTGRTCVSVTNDSTTFLLRYSLFDDCRSQTVPLSASPQWYSDSLIVTVIVNRNQAPVIACPDTLSFSSCEPDTFFYDIQATDPDFDPLTYEVLSGNASINGNTVSIFGDTPGQFDITVSVTDDKGLADTCVIPVVIAGNNLPYVNSAPDFQIDLCNLEEVCFKATADDLDFDIASVTTNIGTYDTATDMVCFLPDTAGLYTVIVSAVDSCGAVASDTTLVTVTLNQPPTVTLPADYDLTVCQLDTICFDVLIDGSYQSYYQEGFGIFDPQTGTFCFAPDTAGTYTFVIGAFDKCGVQVADTVSINVGFNDPPSVDLGADTSVYQCVTEEILVDVTSALPFASLTNNLGLYNDLTGQISFTPDSAGLYELVVAVTDSCGLEAVDTINIDVIQNIEPTVTLPADSWVLSCLPDTICLDAQVYAPDGDITLIDAGIGTYDATTGAYCFVADTAGTYELILTVTDSCGVIASDTSVVIVDSPGLPVVTLPDNFSQSMCNLTEICFDLSITGDSIVSYTLPSFGTFDPQTGKFCFAPDTSGIYEIAIGAVNECGVEVTDTVLVSVSFPVDATVSLPTDFSVLQCVPEEICVPLQTSSELVTQGSNIGLLDSTGTNLCFTPDTAGLYTMIAYATDSCDNMAADTVLINVEYNQPPTVVTADDYSATICYPETLCFTTSVTDLDNNLFEIATNFGSYDAQTGNFCFYADTTGSYQLIVTATDSCGAITSDTTNVTVTKQIAPTVVLPADFTASLCGNNEVCIDALITGEYSSIIAPTFGIYDSTTNQICFTADTAGIYPIEFGVVGNCDIAAVDTVLVTVVFPSDPIIELGNDTSLTLCEPGPVCLPVTTIDNIQNLTSNLGQYNDLTGELCFNADTAGSYRINVSVTDSCGAVAYDSILVNVNMKSAPAVSMSDTTVYLCYPKQICLDALVTDADNDIASITLNQGEYINDLACFTPYDSGTYEIILTAVDSCGNSVVDTAYITVLTDQGIEIITPPDTSVFTCSLVDTFCFPIEGIPENATVEVWGINTWYDSTNQTICFWSECSNTNKITVMVTTACETYTSTFSVDVICNSTPLVILPPDKELLICETQEICIPVGISDADKNISDITVTGGLYNPRTNQVCFTADTAGTYTLTVTAVDSCGATDTDEILVHVTGNSPPTVAVALVDSLFSQCVPEEICLPVDVADVDGNIQSVVTTLGQYNDQTGQICFTPDTAGYYCGEVIVTDSCGLSDTTQFCVSVETGDFVAIECEYIDPVTVTLCDSSIVCLPLNVTGTNYQVTSSIGSWADNQLCFFADTSGLYNVTVVATTECSADTCVVPVNVVISTPVAVTCPTDTTVLLCGPDTLSFDFSYSASVDTVVSTGSSYISGGQLFVPVLQAGSQTISLIGSGACSADTCSFTVTTVFNSAPVVTLTDIDPITSCELPQICVAFTASDPDGDDLTLTASLGTIVGNTICLEPTEFGAYTIVLTATDSCGLSTSDTTVVTLAPGISATILCPSSPPIDTICGPDTIRVVAVVSPAEAEVIVSPVGWYDAQTGEVVIPVDQTEIINVKMVATADCGSDTCQFDVSVFRADPPKITAPARIDTLLCLLDQPTVCYPISVIGTDVSLTVTDGYTLTNDSVCFTVTEAGVYNIDVIADGYCGADTFRTVVHVMADQAPELTLPSFDPFVRCIDDTTAIILDGIYANDAESTIVLSMSCGDGTFELITTDSGQVSFVPDRFGFFDFCIEVFDGCNTTTGSFTIEVIEEMDCDLCARISFDFGECTPVGVMKEIDLVIESMEPIGGLDLLISYDVSVMTFNWVSIENSAISEWEYFTHRLGDAECGTACPSGLVRFIGIADMNNGPLHPSPEALNPNGVMATLGFQVANDQNLGDQFLPINFVWYSCADNSLADPTGNNMMVDLRILNAEQNVIWDEDDDIMYPSISRPFGVGAPDACIQTIPGKPAPQRCIEFINGGICVIHPDSIDDRGDINLNGVAYEIGDAVVFSNFFIYGMSAFTISIAGQTAASDVNADGLTLSVGDLVYLIRVIVGDADPIPRFSSYEEPLIIAQESTAEGALIRTEAISSIGAARLAFSMDAGVVIEDVRLGKDASDMMLMWDIVEGQLKVLIYDFGTNTVMAGNRELVEVSFNGKGNVNLAEFELVDYYGQPYETIRKGEALPSDYGLYQNYPNPFNPTTIITFALPYQTGWSLTIFNVTGAVVREYTGTNDAGVVSVEWDAAGRYGARAASGVYFYRLQTNDFVETKKMVLLK